MKKYFLMLSAMFFLTLSFSQTTRHKGRVRIKNTPSSNINDSILTISPNGLIRKSNFRFSDLGGGSNILYSANNGITEVTDILTNNINFQLGGPLVQNTTINTGLFDYTLGRFVSGEFGQEFSRGLIIDSSLDEVRIQHTFTSQSLRLTPTQSIFGFGNNDFINISDGLTRIIASPGDVNSSRIDFESNIYRFRRTNGASNFTTLTFSSGNTFSNPNVTFPDTDGSLITRINGRDPLPSGDLGLPTFYDFDGTLSAERTVNIDAMGSLNFVASSNSIFFDQNDFELNASNVSVESNDGNGLQVNDGTSTQLRGDNGLQINWGTGGLITQPTIGQVLTAVNSDGSAQWMDLPSGGTSNLQSVTDIGNSTTNDLISGQTILRSSGRLDFSINNGFGTATWEIQPSGSLTDINGLTQLVLPQVLGQPTTIVTSVNGNLADSAGNVVTGEFVRPIFFQGTSFTSSLNVTDHRGTTIFTEQSTNNNGIYNVAPTTAPGGEFIPGERLVIVNGGVGRVRLAPVNGAIIISPQTITVVEIPEGATGILTNIDATRWSLSVSN